MKYIRVVPVAYQQNLGKLLNFVIRFNKENSDKI